MSKDIFTRIESPEIEKSELILEKLKNELGEKEFQKLAEEIAPKAEEIIKRILEGTSV